MSHVARIELEINDIDTLKAACRRLGIDFVCGQKSYAWYGTHVGDYPIPEGFTMEDMGRCDHAIRVPGASYEIGVVKRGSRYVLLWDHYSLGGLERALGKNAGRLKQAYAVERVHMEVRLKGYRVIEKQTERGIQLRLTA